jgi:hypothetical protein
MVGKNISEQRGATFLELSFWSWGIIASFFLPMLPDFSLDFLL